MSAPPDHTVLALIVSAYSFVLLVVVPAAFWLAGRTER